MSYCLISWGANSHGQLGQGMQSEECLLPRPIELFDCSLDVKRVKKIVGGAGHTLILDDQGHVYSCGWNNKGQAGFPDTKDILQFRRIGGSLKSETIVDVACGWDSSAALTNTGVLFLWGSNCFGQLGKEIDTLRWTHVPFPLPTDRKIKHVSMGLRHTAVITEDGKVLVSGADNKGQLGLCTEDNKKRLSNRCTFMEVSSLSNVEDVVCGQHHTIAITKEKDMYVFGDNKHGQLGLNPKTFQKIMHPMKVMAVEFSSSIKTYSGWSHVLVLHDGDIFSWGRNTYGQLSSSEIGRLTPWRAERIQGIPKIQQVAVGSEHNIALTEDGSIICWGWNEHGNCGNGNTFDVHFPTRVTLAFEYLAILVGCGAGHSMATDMLRRLCMLSVLVVREMFEVSDIF